MSNIQGFKLVKNNLYYLVLDDIKACSSCGEGILDAIHQHQISCDAQLIFDTGTHQCGFDCNYVFLSSMSHFRSIAYIVGEKKELHDPFPHADLVTSQSPNTHYFSNYDDAYNWSLTQ